MIKTRFKKNVVRHERIELPVIHLYSRVDIFDDEKKVVSLEYRETDQREHVQGNLVLSLLRTLGITEVALVRFVIEDKDGIRKVRASAYNNIHTMEMFIDPILKKNGWDVLYNVGGDKGAVVVKMEKITREMVYTLLGFADGNPSALEVKSEKMPTAPLPPFKFRVYVSKPYEDVLDFVRDNRIVHMKDEDGNDVKKPVYNGIGYMRQYEFDKIFGFNAVDGLVKISGHHIYPGIYTLTTKRDTIESTAESNVIASSVATAVTGIMGAFIGSYIPNRTVRVKGNIQEVPDHEFLDQVIDYTDFYSVSSWIHHDEIVLITNTEQVKGAPYGWTTIDASTLGLHQVGSAMVNNMVSHNIQYELRGNLNAGLKRVGQKAAECLAFFQRMDNGDIEARKTFYRWMKENVIESNKDDIDIDASEINNDYVDSDPTFYKEDEYDSTYKLTIVEMLESLGWPVTSLYTSRSEFNARRAWIRDHVIKGRTPGWQGYLSPIQQAFHRHNGKLYPIGVIYDNYKQRYVEGLVTVTGFPCINIYCTQEVFCMSREDYMKKTGYYMAPQKYTINVGNAALWNRDHDGDLITASPGIEGNLKKMVDPILTRKADKDSTPMTFIQRLFDTEFKRLTIGMWDSYMTCMVLGGILMKLPARKLQQMIQLLSVDVQYRIDSAKGLDNSKKGGDIKYMPVMALSGRTFRKEIKSTWARMAKGIYDSRTPKQLQELFKYTMKTVAYNFYSVFHPQTINAANEIQANPDIYIKASGISNNIAAHYTKYKQEADKNIMGYTRDLVDQIYASIANEYNRRGWQLFYNKEERKFVSPDPISLIDILSRVAIVNLSYYDPIHFQQRGLRSNVAPFVIARDLGIIKDMSDIVLNVIGNETAYLDVDPDVKPIPYGRIPKETKLNTEHIIPMWRIGSGLEGGDKMDGIDITKLIIKSPFDLVGDVKEEIATVVETAEETVEVASNTTTIDDIDILKLSISIPFELIPNQDTAVTAQ